MSILYEQTTVGENAGGVVSSPFSTAAFGSANIAGNAIIVIVAVHGVSSDVLTGPPTDSNHNNYVQVGATYVNAGIGVCAAMYVAYGIAGGAGNVVTITWTGTVGTPGIYAMEYQNVHAFDVLQPNASTTGTTMTSGNFTTSYLGVIVAMAMPNNTGTAAGAGYTKRTITATFATVIEDLIGAPIGANDATATQAPSGGWVMLAGNFYSLEPNPTDTIFFGMT